MAVAGEGLYIVLISVHGLVRGEGMELGRDADTGGQIKYVVELARALAAQPRVARVDLLTRQVFDPKVDAAYGEPIESLGRKAQIVRLPCGPRRYLRKEVLWPHLDSFVDHALQHLRRIGRVPDVVHSHYADAGYVGQRLTALLGVPLIHTGHSLGRDKLRRLLDKGTKESVIEAQYNIGRRIEAEEAALDSAALVIASTHQEVEQQYALYDNYHPGRMEVIPPGVDLSRYHPPRRLEPDPPIREELARFLRQPRKPMILALSRADERKNIATLVRVYGESPELQKAANLVIVAGNRDDIREMEPGARKVLSELLFLIDRYDLHGRVAFPKHHQAHEVPELYRLAAKSYGVFVNPALVEPFGLTLIEAAASGLPLVATHDGGPRDIIGHCKNGVLVDPLDREALTRALLFALESRERWRQWARNGIGGTQRHYSWGAHAQAYLKALRRTIDASKSKRRQRLRAQSRLPTVDRILVANIDGTLLGDHDALYRFLDVLRSAGHNVGFGVATGRSMERALEVLEEWDVPTPDLLVTNGGTDIHYRKNLAQDINWLRHINYRWELGRLRNALEELPGLKPQEESEQGHFKVSYYVDRELAPSRREIVRHLRQKDLHANVILSFDAFLDVLPIRASKGLALRYLAMRWGLPLERILVAADANTDAEMLGGNTLGVVVGNHDPDLLRLRNQPRVYFAAASHAAGILEGMAHYDFLGAIRVPGEEPPP